MTNIEEIKRLLNLCDPKRSEKWCSATCDEECFIHPLEQELHAKRRDHPWKRYARAGGLTLRMMRGVIAEAAFGVEIVERLKNWKSIPASGDPAYDFLLKDRKGPVRVQVKLQRSKKGSPWLANQANRTFRALPADMYVVEIQKTRGGKKKNTGAATRPYRFGEFDLLAVALYPSTRKWDTFMYTVGDWLIPDPLDNTVIFKYQPVASTANEDWTDDFQLAVAWMRSGTKKTIRAQ